MPILQQYLYVIGIFQGIVLACLLVFGSQVTTASRILGGWCFFLALSFLGPFITINNELNLFSIFIGWSYFLPASFGAFFYLYCRHALVNKAFKYSDIKYFLPLLICLILNFDILFAAPLDKLSIVQSGGPQTIGYVISDYVLFLQAFVYLGLSASLIYKYQRSANETLSSFNPQIFNWLWKLLLLDLIIWFLKILSSITVHHDIFYIMSDMLIIVLIYSIAMAQWRNQKLFKIEQLGSMLPTKLEQSNKKELLEESSDVEPSPGSISNGVLGSTIRLNLLKEIIEHMEEQQSFLDNQLTLPSLADSVGMSSHHLSEVLNQQEGKNFYQFVNQYRIDYICDRLKGTDSIQILDLAMEAGFSSKSTFNAAFKQFTGSTPSQYRKINKVKHS